MSEKKLPSEWEQESGIKVWDPDGWRGHRSSGWDTPIDREEWTDRSSMSTIEVKDMERFKEFYES